MTDSTTVVERLAVMRARLAAPQMTTDEGLVDLLEFVRVSRERPVAEVDAWLKTLTLDEVHGLNRLADVAEHVTNTFRLFAHLGFTRLGQVPTLPPGRRPEVVS